MVGFVRLSFVFLIFGRAVIAKPRIPSINSNSTDITSPEDLQQISETGYFSNQNETLIVTNGGNVNFASHDHGVTIQLLHAQCSSTDGLTITVEFSGPFNGVIYSDKYFSVPKCRYLEANSGKQKFTFSVPTGECGTIHEISSQTIKNVIIFQMDEIVQEKWDVAKRISCDYSVSADQDSNRKQRKMVFFKPLSLGMLDVMDHVFKDDFNGLTCSMDIMKGTYPNMTPIDNDGQVETGDLLSILITLKDSEKQYDMSVKDCWALDSENFDDARANKMQLMGSFDGCAITSKLMSKWSTIHLNDTNIIGGDGTGGRSLMAYANLTAFKFPASNRVHLSCNIEVCKGKCDEEDCNPNESDLISIQPHPTSDVSPTSGSGH